MHVCCGFCVAGDVWVRKGLLKYSDTQATAAIVLRRAVRKTPVGVSG